MSVFSKLLDKSSKKYGIPHDQLTKGLLGTVTVLYLLKLGYPYLSSGAKVCLTKVRNEKVQISKAVRKPASPIQSRKPAVGLDRAFVRQLLMLLRIMIPSWKSREVGLLTCATFTLLARTFLSVYVATLEGQIVKRIVLRDVHGFFWMMARWFAIAFPATFVNSTIRYLEGQLALSFR